MKSKANPRARQREVVIQSLGNEILLYDLKSHKAYCLNEMSALMWDLCDGNTSVSDIGRQLSRVLNSSVTEDFVWLALNELKKNDLLDDNQEIPDKFDGLSRREVIRRIGLASMTALPVITSLVAPTAAMAQSASCPPGSPNPAGRRAGQPVGFPINAVVAGCSVLPNVIKNNTYDLAYGSQYCSADAVYSGTCVDNGSFVSYTCVCA